MSNILEICVENFESAQNAFLGGADRIELCNNLKVGGLTPDVKLANLCLQNLDIPLFTMIRPRPGNFCYTDQEVILMEKQIRNFRNLGVHGFVLGCLTKDGTIQLDHLEHIMTIARPLPITFHRAFDETTDPFSALENLIELGIERLLTSGQRSNALEGKGLITQLVNIARNNLNIIAGAGINPDNIAEILNTGAHEFHSSARTSPSSPYHVDIEVVRRLRNAID
ncbi:MAG: copper homeostasis protein CutC [Bacteroidia bacterium]|nr:copper homeostasis protein CutC [Bacteroidia bacterium]